MDENMNFDNEVLAYLSTRKVELMTQHDEYIADHPEIREVLNDFLSSVLLSKPVSQICSLCLCHRNFVERCIRVRQRVLPSLQPNSIKKQTTHLGWPIRRR